MIYFCADDYGISAGSNQRIEECMKYGILNKTSVLLNGETADFKKQLSAYDAAVGLHINLIEGRPLSETKDIPLLVADNGYFKHSFGGLLRLSLSPKRKVFAKQVYTEIQTQIRLWKSYMGDEPVMLDSHQHIHMIPLIFKTLMRVIEDEGLKVSYLRVPSEPILQYILTPSLYLTYSLSGAMKQWLLKFFAGINRKRLKKSKIPTALFMGAMFSGKVDQNKLTKMLPRYIKLAEKRKSDIEIGLHPGYLKAGEKPIEGSQKGFAKFYFSPWRKTEYDTLLNFKLK